MFGGLRSGVNFDRKSYFEIVSNEIAKIKGEEEWMFSRILHELLFKNCRLEKR